MEATYYFNINELNNDFLSMLKKQFSNAKAELVIRDLDETDYLNSSSANKKALENAIQEVSEAKLIHKSIDALGTIQSLGK